MTPHSAQRALFTEHFRPSLIIVPIVGGIALIVVAERKDVLQKPLPAFLGIAEENFRFFVWIVHRDQRKGRIGTIAWILSQTSIRTVQPFPALSA